MTDLDAIVHHHVPVLTSQDLQRCSFTNASIIVNYKRGISYWVFRNLEDSEASLEEVVKSGAGSLRTKFATEELEKRFTRVKRVDEEKMAPACRGGRR